MLASYLCMDAANAMEKELTWQTYLAYGSTKMPVGNCSKAPMSPPGGMEHLIIPSSRLTSNDCSISNGCKHDFIENLRLHGWSLLEVDVSSVRSDDSQASNHSWLHVLEQWETIVSRAFSLRKAVKQAAGNYRTEQGVSVGYRLDKEREFFETRLRSDGIPEPDYSRSVEGYADTIKELFAVLSSFSMTVADSLASYMGIDPQFFYDITDIASKGMLPRLSTAMSSSTTHCTLKDAVSKDSDYTHDNDETASDSSDGSDMGSNALSSSLLRVCKYGQDDDNASPPTAIPRTASPPPAIPVETAPDKGTQSINLRKEGVSQNVWFGAHTDSCLFTVAPCSSVAGLEIVDQQSNEWVCPELLALQRCRLSAGIHNSQYYDGGGAGAGGAGAGGGDVVRNVPSNQINHCTSSGSESLTESSISSPSKPKLCHVIVFVGEFLQVLSKHRFKAAVHRVVENPAPLDCCCRTRHGAFLARTSRIGTGAGYSSGVGGGKSGGSDSGGGSCGSDVGCGHSNMSDNNDSNQISGCPTCCDSLSSTSNHQPLLHPALPPRISAPFLVRGRHSAIIRLHDHSRYRHPGGEDALSESLMPNLDGTSMKMMHKLLDLKRQKCFRDNGSKENSSWVLSAYPVPPLPT